MVRELRFHLMGLSLDPKGICTVFMYDIRYALLKEENYELVNEVKAPKERTGCRKVHRIFF